MASRLLSFDLAGIAPETGAPPPDRVLSGSPRFLTWNLDEAGGGLFAGVWEASPGAWRIAYEEWEFCHILAGISIITEDGGAASRVKAGDSFVLKPGFTGIWEVVETTRKAYVIRL